MVHAMMICRYIMLYIMLHMTEGTLSKRIDLTAEACSIYVIYSSLFQNLTD